MYSLYADVSGNGRHNPSDQLIVRMSIWIDWGCLRFIVIGWNCLRLIGIVGARLGLIGLIDTDWDCIGLIGLDPY